MQNYALIKNDAAFTPKYKEALGSQVIFPPAKLVNLRTIFKKMMLQKII